MRRTRRLEAQGFSERCKFDLTVGRGLIKTISIEFIVFIDLIFFESASTLSDMSYESTQFHKNFILTSLISHKEPTQATSRVKYSPLRSYAREDVQVVREERNAR
jgi:hypothetical protein